MGIKGWANFALPAGMKLPKTPAPHTPSRSGGGNPNSGEGSGTKPKKPASNPAAKAERDAKDVLATISASRSRLAKVKEVAEENPEMGWATSMLAEADQLIQQLADEDAKHSGFAVDLASAALSPARMRDLRKAHGEQWLETVLVYTSKVKAISDRLCVCVDRLVIATASGKRADATPKGGKTAKRHRQS